jgi:hypothetical protein
MGTILMEKRIEDITGTFIHAGKDSITNKRRGRRIRRCDY